MDFIKRSLFKQLEQRQQLQIGFNCAIERAKKKEKGKKNMTPTVHFRLSLARSLTLSGKKLGITATEFYFYF